MIAYVNVPVLPLYKKEKDCQIIEDEVLYGMPVTLLENTTHKERVKIRTHYQYEGYVALKDLWQGKMDVNQAVQWVYTAHTVVDVLSVPKVQGEILMTLPMGCFLRQLESADENGWIKIQLVNGQIGYVKERYLMKRVSEREKDEMIFREQLIQTGLKYLGTQYRWGGKSTYGIDCSGLCAMSYMLNGVIIFRDSRIEEGFPIHEIPLNKVKRGDLLYFKGHIGMWLGDNMILHSTAKKGREGVVIDSLDPKVPGARTDLWDIFLKAGSLF